MLTGALLPEMAFLKKNDFVEIEFVGRVKQTGKIFDLTDENLAKKEGLYDKNYLYGPKIICVGQSFLIKGIDNSLEGKEEGKSYTVEIKDEDAFGNKRKDLVQVIPEKDLHKQKIRPFVGLKLNAGGMTGNVRSVSGGRVTVDFNHPLAGKNLVYEIKVGNIVMHPEKKLRSLLFYGLGISRQYKLEIKGNKAKLKFEIDVPNEIVKSFMKKVKEIIPELELEI